MIKSFAELQISKFSSFDGIEYKTAKFLNKEFPFHFHQEWSLALIEAGSELIKIDKVEILLNTDALILIPPFLAHSNSGNLNAYWQYRCLYINSDTANYFLKLRGIYEPVIQQTNYCISYNKILVNKFKQIKNNQLKNWELEKLLSEIFVSLYFNNRELSLKCNYKANQIFNHNEIIDYLNSYNQNKITLEHLSSKFKYDKFKLMRSFKKKFGVSPQEYITSIRIENAKQLIFKNNSLVDIALSCGFYDQSHFTNTFKKFVGLTPLDYKNSCNIFQDIKIYKV
jgi:AraC-like DNA-binding protein